MDPFKCVESIIVAIFPWVMNEAISLQALDMDFRKLKTSLMAINSLLADAEERLEIEGDHDQIKGWIAAFRDIKYDTEDFFDEVEYERVRREVEDRDQVSTFSSVGSLIIKAITRAKTDWRSSRRVRELQKRVVDVQKDAQDYKFKKSNLHFDQLEVRRQTSSTLVEHVIGRDKDKEYLINMLKSVSDVNSNFMVISIFGIGGVGKTTLAQVVFQDESVKFDFKVWVCVSNNFDVNKLTDEILVSVCKQSNGEVKYESYYSRNLDTLQNTLRDALDGKTLLLVLDDVWDDDKTLCGWDNFKKTFGLVKMGSKILVTTRTRSKNVVRIMSSTEEIKLKSLSDEDFRPLFKRLAFGGSGNISGKKLLEKIGEEIMKKLGGSPLAAKTVGRLLCSDLSVANWNKILKSDIWKLQQNKDDIIPALMLSYLHLTPELKPCFAFCSLFPKDYEWKGRDLILMWITHGFVRPQEHDKDRLLEDVGTDYLNGLVNRCMLQRNEDGDYVMHDLIHDMAQKVFADECFALKEDTDLEKIPSTIRHLSIFSSSTIMDKVENLSHLTKLRTLICFPEHGDGSTIIDLDGICMKLRHLRLLDIRCCPIMELPKSIAQLKHLRYLNLSYTEIRRLPESLCSLYNMQVLDLKCCYYIRELPVGMNKLVNLRHLFVEQWSSWSIVGIGKLLFLQEVDFHVSIQSGHTIAELKFLNRLKKLRIQGLNNVSSKEEASQAELAKKIYLRKLHLEWSAGSEASSSSSNAEEVLEGLRPNESIEIVYIRNYSGVRSPSWMDDQYLLCIQEIHLKRCKNWETLPPLGQLPDLKKLMIYQLHGVKHIGAGFFGEGDVKGFPSLETLEFYAMPEWETWEGVEDDGTEIFPNLLSFHMKCCPKLKNIPLCHPPPKLKELHLTSCEGLTSGLVQRESSCLSLPPSLEVLVIQGCGVTSGSIHFRLL